MEDSRIVKGVTWATPEGKKRGRPRGKWRKAIIQDIREKRSQTGKKKQGTGTNGRN